MTKEYGLTLGAVYDLTPRQLHDVYFHAREESGAVKIPERPRAPADEAARLERALAMVAGGGCKAPPEVLAKIRDRLEEIRGGNSRRHFEGERLPELAAAAEPGCAPADCRPAQA